ncbi:MAG: T9SS type A sorting domain-containing protein [Bacteroidales bacterium]|nr:T9SS type A sorting domain-containing protein [Bacteroidales bacterium]
MRSVYFDISPRLSDIVQDTLTVPDRSWKDFIEINPANRISNDRNVPDSFLPDPLRQTFFGKSITDTTIQNFEGVSAQGYYPPDVDGDVGPAHYFQVTNVKYAIYNKNGVKLIGPLNNSSIFSGLPNNSNDGDAVVLYDENADRWLFSQFSLPNYPYGPFYQNVAISQTPDPTGSWFRYQFQFPDMPDYPKLSVWADGYYMTIRRFASGSGNFLGPAAVSLNRNEMLAGNPSATMIMFDLPASFDAPLSADCDSDFPPVGTPCPVCCLLSTQIYLYEFHSDWVTPANSTFENPYNIPITPVTFFPGYINPINQKGTNAKLDAMSDKHIMFRMPFRRFSNHWSMLLNTTVNTAWGNVAGIRWMELRHDGSEWSLYQEGTYSPDNNHRWMGSIAMDSAGNIALGYSISSSSMYPSIRYTGRLNGDPLGFMTIAEKGIYNGGGSQTNSSGRWGDYSAMVADPTEIGKFWYTQEYYSSTSNSNWKTRVGSFSFADVMSLEVTATPDGICSPGDSIYLEANAFGGSGIYTYSWGSIPVGFSSNEQNAWLTPATGTNYYCTVSDGTISKTDSVHVVLRQLSAGNDITVLNTVQIVNIYGQAAYVKKLLWTTSGDGYFWKDNIATTYYYPGPMDITTGVTLTLTAFPKPACIDTIADEMAIHFVPAVGVPEAGAEAFSLFLRPNPTKGLVTMNLNGLGGSETAVFITTMQGKFVHRETIPAGQNATTSQIDLSGFPSGIYLVRIQSQLGTIVQKLVVE